MTPDLRCQRSPLRLLLAVLMELLVRVFIGKGTNASLLVGGWSFPTPLYVTESGLDVS